MSRYAPVGAAIASLWIASHGSAQTICTFELIPQAISANDMSPDGRWIVGETDLNGDFAPDGGYRFDTLTNTMLLLPAETIHASAVSDDGKFILGDIPDPADPDPSLGTLAALWSAETDAWQSIGYLPNAGECPSRSDGFELSADGSVAVGLSWESCSGRGYRWTDATGMQQLQVLAFGANRASVVSADGNLIGGFAQGTMSRTPAIWDSTGNGQLLDPPNGDARGEVQGINDAGTILLGTWGTTEPSNRAVKWTKTESGWQRQMLGTGSLQGPFWMGVPMDIADDGTIVGFDFYLGNRVAWMLDGGAPPYLNFKTWVEAHGGMVGTNLLGVCQAISTNRRKVIGHGYSIAWMVTIDVLGDMNCDSKLDLNDVDPFVQALLDPGAYGTAYPLCPISHGDMNGDGAQDGLDLAGFISGLLAN